MVDWGFGKRCALAKEVCGLCWKVHLVLVQHRNLLQCVSNLRSCLVEFVCMWQNSLNHVVLVLPLA